MICETCIAIKDKPLAYAKCEKCEGWRGFTEQEQAKIDCLDENGKVDRIKYGQYKTKYGCA